MGSRRHITDHAFAPSPSGRYCVHRTRRGWLGLVACGWPKSAHASETKHWWRLRSETATLLRCAADITLEVAHSIATAHRWLGLRKQHRDLALGVCSSLGEPATWTEDYRAQLLEAAQLLDEGWPHHHAASRGEEEVG